MNNQVSPHVPRIGELLLRNRLVTEAQLNEAFARQQEQYQPIGQILVENGDISKRQLRSCLKRQASLKDALLCAALSLAPVQYAHSDTDKEQFSAYVGAHLVANSPTRTSNWNDDFSSARTERTRFQQPRRHALLQSQEPAWYANVDVRPAIAEIEFTDNQWESTGWNLVRGEFSGRIGASENGLRYQFRVRKEKVKLEATFRF